MAGAAAAAADAAALLAAAPAPEEESNVWTLLATGAAAGTATVDEAMGTMFDEAAFSTAPVGPCEASINSGTMEGGAEALEDDDAGPPPPAAA